MGIKRANYNGKICIAVPIGAGWYRCVFANKEVRRINLNKEFITLFEDIQNQNYKID